MEIEPHGYPDDDREIQQLMYEVPGYGEPNIDRYLKARKRSQSTLEGLTLKLQFTECANPNDQYTLLKNALTSTDIQLQKSGAELVPHAEGSMQNELQQLADQATIKALSSENPEEQIIGARMAQYASVNVSGETVRQISVYIERYLKDENALIQKIGAQMIALLPEDDRPKYEALLLKHLNIQLSSHHSQYQINAARLMRYVSDDAMPQLITKVLSGNNTQAQTVVVQYIKRLKPPVATPLLRQVLNTNNLHLKQVAAETVTRVFRIQKNDLEIPSDISKAITQTTSDALASDDSKIRKIGADMLKNVTDADELSKLIQSAINSDDVYVQTTATKAIPCIYINETFRGTMLNLVLQALRSNNRNVQKAAVAVARHVPMPGKNECMEEAFILVSNLLQSQNKEEQKQGAEMAYYVTHPRMGDLFTIIESDPELLETLMFSRLYPHEQDTTNGQRRVKFAKTGSAMTILRGGTLERKLIIRHIEKRAFLAWMRACEQYNTWLNAGFDYIPVEPIQSFAFRKHTVDVYAGFLDIDLKHWLTVSNGRFKQELLDKRDQIISVLRQLGIRHSDLHWGNFFLRFPRRADGSIDTQTLPNIYVGDFDKSQIKVNLNISNQG